MIRDKRRFIYQHIHSAFSLLRARLPTLTALKAATNKKMLLTFRPRVTAASTTLKHTAAAPHRPLIVDAYKDHVTRGGGELI